MANEVKEPKMLPLENDYRNVPGRWNAPQMSLERHSDKAAIFIKDQQRRQREHDDKLRVALRAAESAKGSPLTFVERQTVLVGK